MPQKKRPPADPKAPSASPAKKPAPRPKPGGKPVPGQPAAAATKRPASPKPKREPSAARKRPAPKAPRSEALSILMVASEAHPFAKTGGLAEVAGALPVALARLGHSVTLVVPGYRATMLAAAAGQAGARETSAGPAQITLELGGRTQAVAFHRHRLASGVAAVVVEAPDLFDREGLYGEAEADYGDNPWRFAIFSRAALEYARLREERPSIVHAHDWQTGLVPVYQKMHLSDDRFVGGVPVVFTIHNLAFQGLFPSSTLGDIGLGWDLFNPQALEYWGQVSYLKGGINFSEKITTVSPGYSREIVTPELGFGFEGVLSRRADDLIGILNGIDTERWNPDADPFGTPPFSAKNLSGKREAKRLLLHDVGLPDTDEALGRPVIGLISRLTDQKGLDLFEAAARDLLSLDAVWVMLGSGERRYEELWRRLCVEYPQQVSATIGFDERLAHLIEAGADAFLMPSRFEPCGLNQLYSLRYGTIPVVRAVGGLDDTVEDLDPATGRGTGFKFRDYSPQALVDAVRRALDAYRNPDLWRRMQHAGMVQDHSWDASAREYVKVYRGLTRTPHGI
jgi:starch synthase